MPNKILPRKPLILRNVPDKYYSDNQLAGVIQAVETSFFSLCFAQYPQAFMTFYSGIEKLCKNIAGLGKNHSFWKSYQAAAEKLELQDEIVFEKITLQDGKSVFRFQREWTNFRNEFEHQGDSPSYDLPAANHLLGEAWDAFRLLLNKGYNYDIEDAFLLETRDAFQISRDTKGALDSTDTEIKYPYFMHPLVQHLRHLTSPTFQTAGFDHQNCSNSHLSYDALQSWKNKIRKEKCELDWEELSCPVCNNHHAQLGYTLSGDGENGILNFSIFTCPECSILAHDHATQPFLAENLLREQMLDLIPRIEEDTHETLTTCWGREI